MAEPVDQTPETPQTPPAETAEQGINAALQDKTSPETKPAAKPDAQPEAKLETKPEAKPQAKDKPADTQESDQDSAPISDWTKVDLGLPKDAPINEELLASFGEAAVKMGLTPAQAKAAVHWQLEAFEAAHEEWMNGQINVLKKAWGKKASANQTKITELITRIDGKVTGFSDAFAASGAANSALVLQGLLAVAAMLEEDGLNSGSGSGGGGKPETAEEGIRAALANGGQG